MAQAATPTDPLPGIATSKALGCGDGRSEKNQRMSPPDMKITCEMLLKMVRMPGTLRRMKREEPLCRASLGQPAPNTGLHRMDGSPLKLLDLAKPGRLLVLNFGSCS